MYKIGIDARLYSQTGVGIYLRNLLYFLEKIAKKGIFFYIYLLPEDYDKVKFKSKYFLKKLTNSRWHSFSEQINFASILYKDDLDLVHFTYFSYPVLYRKKFISTIHDVTPIFYKTGRASTKNQILYEVKYRAFKFVMSQQVKNAQIIITPSHFVKKQLVEIYGQSYASRIQPIYEGVDFELIETVNRHPELVSGSKFRFRNKFGMTKTPFFIYVGNFYPHKNLELLIQAFAKVKGNTNLILIGPDDFFSNRLIQLIKQLNQSKRIIFFHNPKRSDMVFFYKNALALIHPSLSEGFGLPLVEAAYFNLPIIAANIEVFKELLNNKYISFNPLSVKDIAEKIIFFLKQKTKVEYGNLLNKFSFEKMVIETYKLYQQALVKPKEDR